MTSATPVGHIYFVGTFYSEPTTVLELLSSALLFFYPFERFKAAARDARVLQ